MEKERGIRCLATGTGWLYEWASNGMLKKVIRPDGRPVEFRYDALGRRTAKQYFGKITRWVWDRNVPIHEWSYKVIDIQSDEEESTPLKEPTEDITTWVFEAGTFVPTAKIQDGKQYSIVSDYLGTPIQMYDEQGNKTWDCTLDIYGKVLALIREQSLIVLSGIRGSMRMRRRDYIIIGLGTTIPMQGATLVKIL